MVWFLIVKKIEDMFICFDKIDERDGRTDGQTDTERRAAKIAIFGQYLASSRVVPLRPQGVINTTNRTVASW